MLKKATILLSPTQLRAFITDHPNYTLRGELNGFTIELINFTEHDKLPMLVDFVHEDLLVRVKRFPLTIELERYMTREECVAWVSIIGFKGYQVRVKTDSIWQYPCSFGFNNKIEDYEYRTVAYVNSEFVYGEPEEFKVEIKENVKLVESLEKRDVCEILTTPLAVSEFKSVVKFWSAPSLCEYMTKFIGFNPSNICSHLPQHLICENFLKDYFISCGLEHTSNRRDNQARERHYLLAGIYKFLLKTGHLPEPDTIKAKETCSNRPL